MPFWPFGNGRVTPRRALGISDAEESSPRRALETPTSSVAARVAPSVAQVFVPVVLLLALVAGDTQANSVGRNLTSVSASAVPVGTVAQTATSTTSTASANAKPIPKVAKSSPPVKPKVRASESFAATIVVSKPKPSATPSQKRSSSPRRAAETKKVSSPRKRVARLSGARCASGSRVESGLVPNAIKVHRALCGRFSGIYAYGGRRSSSGYHGSGQALDCMIRSQSYG